jgi:stage V sporulation protein D (sporulation-specific penicillin-binding protein)
LNKKRTLRRKKRIKQQKNKFNYKMQTKLAVLFLIVMLAFVGLSIRLIYINKENGETYKKQVLSQQEYDSVTLPFKRGEILDAKGTKLAYSEKVYNLVIDSKLVNQDEAALEPTMKALVSCFDINESEVREFIVQNPTNQYYVVLKQLEYDQIAPFLELQQDTKNNPHIKGVWFEEEYKRIYPYNTLACDVLGFTGSDNNGTFGLEEYYNDTLNGTNGREYGYLNDDSELERTTKAAVDGNTLVTSIDSNIQSIVEKYIKQFNDEHAGEYREGEGGSSNTGVIVMNPNTGEILAMASYPEFDLNNPKDLTGIMSEAEIEAMDEDSKYEALNELWRNFCISDTYEPGSTAKSITISAGLDSGKLTGNEGFYCAGITEVSGHKIKCHNYLAGGHGNITLSGALEQSCNIALIDINQRIGKETFMKYLHNFNFGLKTNIDLAGEARTDTLLYNVDDMVASDLAISSFGQGYNVTMIQMASAFSSIINGGYYYQPHVVTEIRDANGTTVEKIEPRVLKETISENVSEKMRGYLANVCTVGTGTTAVPAGYLIGGKTGTAEKYPRKTGNYVVSFIGFAPVSDPQVVVYVVIDEPNVADQPHSTFAQTVAKGIFTEILPYMNIFRTEELSEEETEELEELGIISVSGNSIGEEEDIEESEESTAEEDAKQENPVLSYEKDPETGNYIEPGTGYLIDPNTFEYVDSTISLLE